MPFGSGTYDSMSTLQTLLGGGADAGIEEKQKEEEQEETVATNFLRGFINRASAQGEAVPPETFDERYAKSKSPGKEFLANTLFGLSAGFTGEKFRSAKERSFQQFVQEEQLNRQRQVLQQRAETAEMQKSFQAAQVLSQLIKNRKDNVTKQIIENVRSTDREADREVKIQQAQTAKDRLGLDFKKFRYKKEIDAFEMQDTGDKTADFARRIVMGRLREQGVDMTTPQGQRQLWDETLKQYEAMQKTEAELNPRAAARSGARGSGVPYVTQVQGPDGTTNVAAFDKTTGKMLWGSNVGRKLTAGQVDDVNRLRNASSNIRSALSLAQNNPDSIGSFVQALPPDVRAIFGKLSPQERTMRLHFNRAISDYILSQSGLAVTDKERSFFTQGLPKFFEGPDTFFPSAYAFAGMLDAAALRSQYGIELDFSDAMQEYMGIMQEYAKKNKTMRGFPILSAEEFMTRAAKAQGKVLRKTVFGNMEVVSAGTK